MNKSGSALISAISVSTLVAAVTVALVHLAIRQVETYAFGLFVVGALAVGFFATRLHGADRELRAWDVLGVTSLAMLFANTLALLVGTDGINCLIVSLPLTLGMAWIGGLAAWPLQRSRRPASRARARTEALAAVPLFALGLAVEPHLLPEPPLRPVTTSVLVDATPEAVWQAVIAFPPIETPPDGVFALGVAYPVAAELDGEGVGAVRRCTFSTGAFVEPVTVWRPGELLAFDVLEQPLPMTETSPWEDLQVPHLSSAFVSERGEFRLTPTDYGRVLLQGTTWYRQHLWPQVYWGGITDALIHRIHGRVLEHVAATAEGRP